MLTVENLHKSFGDKVLFKSINCTIKQHDRIGLIGVNGTGKSSFLKVIAGLESSESGVIQHSKDYKIEYLAQEPKLDLDLTVMDQIYYGGSIVMKTLRNYERALRELQKDSSDEAAQTHLLHMQEKMEEFGAWEANTEAEVILTKLGVTDFEKKVSELSGGQMKRVALAKALIQPANLLILDEPTNHLDNDSVEWLESHLASYQGALLLVTHDRYFLNRVTNYIFELDKGNFYIYEGNYQVFLEKKVERELLEEKTKQKHQNTLRRELAWLHRGPRARSTKQKARIERVGDLKETRFDPSQGEVDFKVGSTRLGKQVIELINVSKAYGELKLINNYSRLIKPGDRIGMIGPNGTGKTTLLNMMAERVDPDQGHVEIGATVKIGYYTQGEQELDGQQRIIDYIKEVAEVIYTTKGEEISAEQMLEHFLFTRAEQWSYIRKLSGGEKRRLYLLKVLMTEPNVLFLDEPTNDLDTQTLSVLEEYLNEFPGVVITVSHDRYFLDRVVNELIVFSDEGKISPYYGNYSEYLDQTVTEPIKTVASPKANKKQSVKKTKLSFHEQKEWNEIENNIMELENQIEKITTAITDAGSEIDKVEDLFLEQQEKKSALETKMERWEELSLLVEEIEDK